MHEGMLTEDLFEHVLAHAREANASRVTHVKVTIGALSDATAESIQLNSQAINTNGGNLVLDGSVSLGYASQVLSDGPVAYWRLGELSGTRAYDWTHDLFTPDQRAKIEANMRARAGQFLKHLQRPGVATPGIVELAVVVGSGARGHHRGTRQSGQPLFEIADLYRDDAILEEARDEALALVEADPDLARPEHAAAREALEERWAGRLSLAQVG